MAKLTDSMLDHLLSAAITGHIDEDDPDLRPLGAHVSEPLFRGLQFPRDKLVVGGIISQWGDCSHWSVDSNCAEYFAQHCDYEQVIDWVAEEKCLARNVAEAMMKLTPVVLELRGADNAIETGRLLGENVDRIHEIPEGSGYETLSEMWDNLLPEKEVTIFDSDFIIRKVMEPDMNRIVHVHVTQK